MAQVELTVHPALRTGLNITTNDVTGASSNTYIFPNNGRVVLYASNASGGPLDVTVVTPNTSDGLAVADRVVEVPDATAMLIGPFPKDIYNNANGLVEFSLEGVITVLAFRV